MKVRLKVLVGLCLLSLAAVWYFWPAVDRSAPVAESTNPSASVPSAATASRPVASQVLAGAEAAIGRSAASTNREFYRLANTTRPYGEMVAAPHAILLENALVDTESQLALAIPAHLQAAGEPGAYIVQARGLVNAAFRAALAEAGAQIVSYIPNNAYLVQLTGAGAGLLAGHPLVQKVLPYEPYFAVQSSLLGLAVEQKPLPPGQVLTLGLFANGAAATRAQIEKLGGQILAQDRSPFGVVVRVRPAVDSDWLALVRLPGVQRVEPATYRGTANDLSRVAMGISLDTVTNVNYLNLSGTNVLVGVNDTGIDPNQPDLATARVIGDSTNSLNDTDGHGTHVAGIIAGNGARSSTLTTAPSGSVTNANFRGKANAAKLYSVGFLGHDVYRGDSYLQEAPAFTNAWIVNNSWVNANANEYDLSAASWDAAVRDALPETTGPQPILPVFAAGNDGGGQNNGAGGNADSILSPATAKNVIAVGALEQYRYITNEVVSLDGTTNAVWQGETDSANEVAHYSARGNVGVQTEGAYGRFKPDVVAPGTFVVSTRSTTWDQAAYYNPTNTHDEFSQLGVVVGPGQLIYGGASVPNNAVGVTIRVVPNRNSPTNFPPNFPIYISQGGIPGPTNSDFATSNNVLSIPPGGGSLTSITPLLNNGFICAVGSPTNFAVNFDFIIQVLTTNDNGNELTVLKSLNDSIGPNYLYDSGTSMSAAAVSGALALLADYFTNTLHTTPSPALLKAMLINGARLTDGYNHFAITNNINYEGWGLVNVPNSLPQALTNTAAVGTNGTPMFFLDQSPTNVLATGDSRTFSVSVPTAAARSQLMRITLAWTDPPGNPAAGVKLVNNLDLVVTNLATGDVYYGNHFSAGSTPYSVIAISNTMPNDVINNVENIWLTAPLGTNYSVTVVGRNVAVNAVTAEQTNVVQDYALVIASGDSTSTNGIVVTNPSTVTPASTPLVSYITSYTNGPSFNQIAGANAPWLSTNAMTIATNAGFATNANLFIGQTNQWHFFVVTNTTEYSNAAFIIFLPETKATPRLGVFASSAANATRPEADLNMFVASTPDLNAAALTNLDLTVISNCVFNVNGDQAALARGGTKFIVYSNAIPQQVYYIGVQCQDQMGGEFGFMPIFSKDPFSSLNPDGSQTVNGLMLPVPIPDGNNAHAGVAYVFALAIYPMDVGGITVTNTITHDNFGDLVGAVSHGSTAAVLNNHYGLGAVLDYKTVYNDDGLPGTVGTDGPGSLRRFRGTEAIGPWMLTEVDDAEGGAGSVTGFTMNIQPHLDLTGGLQQVIIPPQSWYYGYVDAGVGYTNITVVATNLTSPYTPPLELYLNYKVEPSFTNYLGFVKLTNGTPPGNSMSYGPPLEPGRYFIGIYNPDVITHTALVGVKLAFNTAAVAQVNYGGSGEVPLLDDAVTYAYKTVTDTNPIQQFSVGLRVDHPRISDLVFTLISPDNQRYLLMENRGGQSTNGCGLTVITTNIVNVTANGDNRPATNIINVGMTSGTFPITYNFYNVPDQMTVYYGTDVLPANLIFDTGMTNNGPPGGPYTNTTLVVSFPPPGVQANFTNLTIVMNQFGNADTNTLWDYTAGGVLTNYEYLAFTEDANLTTTPIKYAVPPFVPVAMTNFVYVTNIIFQTNSTTVSLSSFDAAGAGNYITGSTVDGWNVLSNQISVVNDVVNAQTGNQFVALANGSISRTLATTVGSTNILRIAYRGPGIVSLWRGENSANDSINGNNGTFLNGAGIASGEVGQAFRFAGGPDFVAGQCVGIPYTLNLANPKYTVEAWVKPTNQIVNTNNQAVIYGQSVGQVQLVVRPGTTGVYAVLQFTTASHTFPGVVSTSQIPLNQFTHLAGTWDGTTLRLYINGVLNNQSTPGQVPVDSGCDFYIGGFYIPTSGACNFLGQYFPGIIDEASYYNRALSLSEIKAIYNLGSSGKFDPTAPSVAQGLSEARLTLAGVVTNIFGNNTSWQTNIVSFVATNAAIPFRIDGLEPGMLLDTVTLTSFQAVTNIITNTVFVANNLYYQPEQSLTPLTGVSPVGIWTLEILDNRAGATNNATLLSWDLNFTFANTNFTIPTIVITNGGAITNTLPGGATAWYQINVPLNADFATNILLFAGGPLNMWFSTNAPPSITNANNVLLLAGQTSGSVTLGTNGSPVNANPPAEIVPGGTYYIGLQNTNILSYQYAFRVDFHYKDQPLELPGQTNMVMNELTTLLVTNEAHSQTNGTISYLLVGAPPWANIDANGIITFSPLEPDGPGVYVITTVASIATAGLSVTNNFNLTVNESNTPPFFLTTPANQSIGTYYTLTVTNAAVDSDIPINPLTYRLVGAPAGMTISSNGVITWTPILAQAPNTYTITTVVTDTNPPAVNAKSLSATNVFQVNVLVSSATKPLAFTESATRVTGSSAQLNGMATANGLPSTAWFEWGQSTAYGISTPPVTVGTNFNVAFVTRQISGLGTNVPYHFRLVVSNAVGVTYGADQIFAQGSVLAWGAAFFGQTTPIPSSLTNLVAGVGVGFDFSLALNYDGTVVAWGDGSSGQTTVPAGLNNAVAVAGGYSHSLALRSDRTVTVWGSNSNGQTNVPPDLTNAVAAVSGAYFCLALRDNGYPLAWGQNDAGQTTIPGSLNNVVAVAAGYSHSLALKNDGTVVAWGNNANGQANVPVGLTNVVAIAAGYYDSLALRSDGTVVAWGYNANGQTNVPSSLTNVTAIAAGGYHCLALKGDGSVWFWGDSSSGQLNNYPANLTNVFTIAGGGFHTLAVKAPFGLNVTNQPPYWANGIDGTTNMMDELTMQTIDNAALDSNSPPQLVFYSLVNPPSFAAIDSFSGMITLNPMETNGPGTYSIVTVATDNGYPTRSATNTFTLVVNEVNTPPFWTNNVPNQTNFVIGAGSTLTVTNTASDSDVPTNALSYAILVSPAASAPAISPEGIITWTPLTAGSFTLMTVVTDSNPWALTNQSLSATNYLAVTVTNIPTPPPPSTNFDISTIVYTNNGFLLTWYAPSNDLFQVQCSTTLSPLVWLTFTNIISYNTNFPASATNATFTFFDDGSQIPFGGTRFYQIIPFVSSGGSNTAPVLPVVGMKTINPLNMLVVTNAATDADVPAQSLTYVLNSTVTGTNLPVINPATGVIQWTPDVTQAGTSNFFTTVVTDSGVPPLSATNHFVVRVNPVPDIGSVTYTNGGFLLTWLAPTNDIFEVQFADNLTAPNWQAFSNLVTYTGPVVTTNGMFSFIDDGGEYPFTGLRFYRIILVGVIGPVSPSSNTVPVLPVVGAQTVNPLNMLVVSNTATDTDVPAQSLTYALTSTVTGTNLPVINPATGVIRWTPDVTQAGTSNLFTTVVTDSGVPSLSATNSFVVVVNPVPDIGSVVYTNSGLLLTWLAPTNDIFQVQFADNLAAPNWQSFSNLVTYTGPVVTTNGVFSFFDNGAEHSFTGLRFYQIKLVGVLPTSPPTLTNTVAISNIIATNGNFLLTWSAPTTNQFNVQWSTNLVPPVVWTSFTNLITSTNGSFNFTDTNTPLLMKFYQLILLP